MNQIIIYDNIQRLLKENNLTPEQLTADCGLDPDDLASLQVEETTLSFEKMLKISNYLHVSLCYLMTGSDSSDLPKASDISDDSDCFGGSDTY